MPAPFIMAIPAKVRMGDKDTANRKTDGPMFVMMRLY